MTPPPAQVRRRFLDWTRPLLPQAVAVVAEGWDGAAVLDRSDLLVLVPTRQAGRRLREALAAHAAARGQAVFPPRVLTLEILVAEAAPAENEASRLESQLAWIRAVREANLDSLRALFPVDPPERNLAWARGLAAELATLQDRLAEIGLRLGDVPERLGEGLAEAARWRQLAELERAHDALLARAGRRDATAARLTSIKQAPPPPGVARVVMLATPDPRPVALTLLARYAAHLPVEIVVFAPATEADAFDAWGRPRPESWAVRPQLEKTFADVVDLCADPEAQARRVADLARAYRDEAGVLAAGVLDPEIMPALEGALRDAEVAAYNPEGRARRGDRLFQLLQALADFARADTATHVATLARQPDVLAALAGADSGKFSAVGFLSELDRVQARHLPADLAGLLRHWRGADGLARFATWHRQLRRGEFPDNVTAVLADLFAGRKWDAGRPEEAALAAAAQAWSAVAGEIASAAVLGGLTRDEAWDLALRAYGDTMEFPDKPPGALELQGWLELVWEDAPHLVLAGCNDGRVPAVVTDDAFMPESLREQLGLKTNALRFAVDAYYLHALAASRADRGRLDVLLGRTSAGGEPLRPSRLLLRCADADLPGRIAQLFRDLPAAAANVAWTRPWRLTPPEVTLPDRLAVTALRAWLDCPFRFYLSRVVGLEIVDPAKVELDAMDFGTLCHGALEAMAREEALRDCTDPVELREFLLGSLDLAVARQFGRDLALPLVVQVESARQRLAAAADLQAQLRAEGWGIDRAEWKFEIAIGGFTVVGKIDRIDRHRETGELRLIDYKTSDTPVNPVEAHLRAPRTGEEPAVWAVWTGAAKPRIWCDLQLPLYARVVAAEFPDATVTCGYFNLPRAATGTALELWGDYEAALAASAWTCAQGVAAAIARREFWPPRELSGREAEYDDFATLFHRGAAASVAWPGTGGEGDA
ncbi:MAG: PD-(D/E)XK nuclease family protein [Cephaloticoccus sp.]